MKQRRPVQIDLFTTAKPSPPLAPDLQQKLLPLIEVLLKEVMAGTPVATEGNGDDEDHA